LKKSSAKSYAYQLKRFCEYAEVPNGYGLAELGLEKIETLLQRWIARHRGKLAPKHLNLAYSAVKRWCQIQGLIKSTKMFREIKFDKSSRKTDALTERMLETEQIKTGFQIADLEDQVDWGLYALCGLRPQIIPQLKVENLYIRNYEIAADKLRFTVKPPLMVIPRTCAGNKGNITFMVFIPTRLAQLLELLLNANDKVTRDTKISQSPSYHSIYCKIKRLFKHPSMRFAGRPYLLRKFADRVLDRITMLYNDEDTKEFLMGHKGRVSAIYQTTGLTNERESELRAMYVHACDRWISQHIFETVSQEQIDNGELLITYSQQIAELDTHELDMLRLAFKSGKVDMHELQRELGRLTRHALDQAMEAKFEQLFLKMNQKYNNH
jgi:integrase